MEYGGAGISEHGGFFKDIDMETEEQREDRILNDDSEHAEMDEAGVEIDFETTPFDLQSYKNSIERAVTTYIDSNRDAINGRETYISGGETGYSKSLYDTVSEYINDDRSRGEYISPSEYMTAHGFPPDREIVEKRTAEAKVFKNNDGTYTSVLNPGPVHYRDQNGFWQDIDLNIEYTEDGNYRNIKNTFESYYSSEVSEFSVNFNSFGYVKWTPASQVYFDRFGLTHELSVAQNSKADVNGNSVSYRNTFENTDEEYILYTDHLKHNLILNDFPEEAGQGMQLGYCGLLELGDGLSLYAAGAAVTESIDVTDEIEIRDGNGNVVYVIPPPVMYEFDDCEERIDGNYRIELVNGGIYLYINTPVSWLKNKDRNYPVVIDPNLYVSIDEAKGGYAYRYYLKYTSGSTSESYTVYTSTSYRRVGFYGYQYSTYFYHRTYRAWFKWDTSGIPDTYSIKQIDFHGQQWRNSYAGFTVNLRGAAKNPEDYSSSDPIAKKKEFFNMLGSGSIYNTSVVFPTASSYKNVDIYRLGGQANLDMQDNLTKDVFYLTMQKVLESFISTGYGYFYVNYPVMAQLYVTYDPCPLPPMPDTGGPYDIPEGTNGAILDASDSFVCGSSVMYYWDTNEDGIYDLASTQPKVFWNKNFPDDYTTNLTLKIHDMTFNYIRYANTTFTVYNINPTIISPPVGISGKEGQTVTFPKIEFTDPGADRWTYYYDFDGDNKVDKSGATITSAGKYYVPSVSWYFCDNANFVNLTIEDEDGGYSDFVEQARAGVGYDGMINTYKRPADPTRDYYYRYLTPYYTSSIYVRFSTSLESYDYDYRGLMKFDSSSVPATFQPTNVTLRTYIYRVNAPGKVGVNDLGLDPDANSYRSVYLDAGDSNILDKEEYVYIDSTEATGYMNLYLDPQNFIKEFTAHSKWYGVGFDRYDEADEDIYIQFRGGSYTSLTISDGTTSYTLSCYTNSGTNRNGLNGYTYFRYMPARNEMWREDTSSYIYIEDYTGSYNAQYTSRGFIKFDLPEVSPTKIVGSDIVVRAFIYGTPNDIKVGIMDLDVDPETAADSAVWNDIDAESIYDDTEWVPDEDYEYYLISLKDGDIIEKLKAHDDWYGVGFKKNSGTSRYVRLYSRSYSTVYYRPEIIVDYRVPFQIPVDIENIDPVLDATGMRISPAVVREGDEVSVSGITYSDAGDCDTHRYRAVIDLGTGKLPIIVTDWTKTENGKIDFTFKAPDDDPEDADLDISKDKVKITIELRDDDYTPDRHYSKITLELMHYEYYRYSWYKDWGVYQNLKPWDEYSVTWSSYPRSYASTTPEDTVKAHGDHVYKPGYDYHFDAFDVTTLAKKWLEGTVENHGVRVQPVTAGKDPNRFFASDYGTASRRPMLRFTPVEPGLAELILQPGDTGKDAMLRDSPYSNSNYGTYTYLTYTYDSSTSSSRYETNGLIEFDLSSVPPESEKTGLDSVSFEITINNVDPVFNESSYKIQLPDGTDITTVKEGQEFKISGLTFTDPAIDQKTENFEYRVNFGNGTYTSWSTASVVYPGEDVVVPNIRATSEGSSNNVIPWRPSFGRLRYQQWYSASQLGGNPTMISAVGFRPNGASFNLAWTTTYVNLRVYLSHTTASTLSSTFANNYGTDRTLVYSGTLTWDHPANNWDWLEIPLSTYFNYDGSSNLVFEAAYSSGSETGSSPAVMDADSSSTLHRAYGYSDTSTSGSVSTGYGLVTKFAFASDMEPFGIIPDIRYSYPDDHPRSGTKSDDMAIVVQLRDDDAGIAETTLGITVENVAPSIERGNILVNGKPMPPNILLVQDYSGYDSSDLVLALEDCGQIPVIQSSTGLTLSEMNRYDLVIWMMGGYYVRYALSTTDRNLITSYINGGGKIILSSTYWYNTYTWAPAFYAQFGIRSGIYSRYLGSTGTTVINGTGGLGGSDKYTLRGGHSEIGSNYNYISMARLAGGTPEFMDISYTSGSNYVMVHSDNPATGSIAMMMGFDIAQIDDTDEQRELIADILYCFGIGDTLTVEINEGDFIELDNWDITDPAEGEPTETMHFQVDWGDGEKGEYANTTKEGGINLPPPMTDVIQVPNIISPYYGGNTIPWGPSFGTRRYMQFYPNSQLGSTQADIISLSFYYNYLTPWSVSYNNLKIYLSHKSTGGLSSTFANNYGTDRTLVFSKSTYSWSKSTAAAEWKTITLDSTFRYNGRDNIVMEVVYSSGSGGYLYFNRDFGGNGVYRLWSSSPTATTGSSSSYGLFTQFGLAPSEPEPKEYTWQAYMHTYRDNPTIGDTYKATINAYDDDLGHGTFTFNVKVNNIIPVIDPKYVMPKVTGTECGAPAILLPQVPFDDPATQYELSYPNEVWTYWWDLDGNGVINNAPDVIGSVPQALMSEKDNRSYGRTPAVSVCVNDDYVNKPIALYIFDDDMRLEPSSRPSSSSGTVSVVNAPPVASIEAYIPMELRIRMSGRMENDLKVEVMQTNPSDPRDVISDEVTVERMPGQPKDNPFADGTPGSPVFVKARPGRKLELRVTFDATQDENDVHYTGKPIGSDPVWLFLDFPAESDYDPRDGDQSVEGHHWSREYKFNAQQDGSVKTETVDISPVLVDKKGYIVGTSSDDSSDDAQFNWLVLSGGMTLPYTRITYYNDGSDPVVNGAFSDTYPSPWDGTAPVTYRDMHEFTYGTSIALALYTIDDDGGRSKTATLSI